MLDQSQVNEQMYHYHGTVPEPGQLVEVRRRQWVVGQVQSSTLSSGRNQQHLVTLSSIDEDALGEENQVIWELEPGAQIVERAGLPQITGWDSAERLEAFLDAVRWGSATNADRSFLQAPFRSGVTIEDYQLEPVVRAIDMARVNLLIADDVGLGKTIEAGLVIQELLVRHRARTVFIVCPASLQVKWKTEMQEKFGLEFRIVDTDYIKRLRRERGIHVNPWTSFPRLISSMDWMKSGEGLRLLKDVLPPHVTYPRKFDILVVDEAHNVAPAAATRYALESQRTRLIRLISPHFTYKLFLSATPHNGYQESFTALLELLDDQRFARGVMPDEKQLQRVMIRRLKSDIVDANNQPIFPVRKLECLEVDYSDEEKRIHHLLQDYIRSRSQSVRGTRYEYGADFVHLLLKKRLFSSPMAFALTLSKHVESLERGITRGKIKTLDERILRKAIMRTEEEYSDDFQAEEAQNEAVEIASEMSVRLTDSQREMLNQLTAWAERAKNRADSKADAILKWLDTYLKPGGEWNNKRVILFTEYRATQEWVRQILVSRGYGGERLMVLHGGTQPDERERIKAAFQAHPDISPVRILLATDAASEGIDLQNYCNYLIHVEIPWNPNVMEQRNGRIDRHGQKERNVYIWNPVGKGFNSTNTTGTINIGESSGDHEYLMRAVLKIDQIRQDLGSVGPVIAQQIEEMMLGKRRTMDTTVAENRAARTRRFVSAERRLKERISRLHEKLLEAIVDIHLDPEHIERAVKVALELAEKPPMKPVSLPGIPDGKVFDVPLLSGSWGRATAGLEHPHTGLRRPITFDREVAKGRDDVVLAHLNHKLVQMCLRLLREELWKLDDVKLLHRVAVRAVPDAELDDPAVVVWSRLLITGGGHHRLHEELTLSGGELRHTGFSRITQLSRLESLLEKSVPIEPSAQLFSILKDRFIRQEESIRLAVEARSRERLKFLENTLLRRKQGEIDDLLTVLDDLERNLKNELEKEQGPRQMQLQLWPEEERNQLRRDMEALRTRLARIPEERKSEIASVESRYANIVDRTFPVAVIFLVPQSQLGEGR
ncbi:helicase domain-containing protein [Alicyclobacillus hesperidum URH17-3-68]|uniref:DISARM system SNF2-like helicase DrmD n=1 Tax=Alicyclobacillus hesperidum TaxID=89784 RepID=UPI000281B312|nr:DISARM system SNF2-like helicase DrmD [Alicyclobacillus hesperidum]EJY55741.1 helicase domain-containing protein [Alicyclobacillus hesperidum URH17-3-68]